MPMNAVESLHSSYTAGLGRRFVFFETLLGSIEKPIRLLDCGATHARVREFN